MIRVELMYKVYVYETDWLMTAEEYEEFRHQAQNLPIFFSGPVLDIYPRPEEEDQADECPDYIEPPTRIEATDYGTPGGDMTVTVTAEKQGEDLKVIDMTVELPEVTESYENLTKSEEKSQETQKKDFSRYIQMFKDHVDAKEIQLEMIGDWGISESTANNYYYMKVKKVAEAEIEAEKKVLEKELEKKLEKKVQVIPPATFEKPKNGKYFSDEDRERIQKKVGIKK